MSYETAEAHGDGRGWLLWSGAKRTWRRFREDWAAIPQGAKRRWLLTLVVGFAAVALVVTAVTLVAKAQVADNPDGAWQQWDRRTLEAIDRQKLISFQNGVLLESFGNLAYLIPLTTGVAVLAVWLRRPMVGLTLLVAYWGARPLILLGWKIWDRPRPDVILGGVANPPLHSYPSGHAALVVAVWGLLAYLWVRSARNVLERVVAVVLTAALCFTVGFARLRLGTHWPSDVIAGWVIGVAWMVAVILTLRTGERERNATALPS